MPYSVGGVNHVHVTSKEVGVTFYTIHPTHFNVYYTIIWSQDDCCL